MYFIDKEKNNINIIEAKTFKELGFKERENIQEWIAKTPESLGEELLIIQKEFDGFNDTSERLDLLALDKDGNLVIIENKLDDSGRDVVWQILKYTSYCSTLTTAQIINLYQDYLNKIGSNENAKDALLEFFGGDEEELSLNTDDQRMFMISNSFRKEVTSTVLWLLKHDIKVQCFKVTPFSLKGEIILQIDQIIPLPETEQYTINANKKEKEERGKSVKVQETQSFLISFWKVLKKDFYKNSVVYIDAVTPKPWYDMGFWKGKGKFSMALGRHTNRVELCFFSDEDKTLFNSLIKYKDEIEKAFGEALDWKQLDGKIRSKVQYEMPLNEFQKIGNFEDQDTWQNRIDWFRENIIKFYNAIYPYLNKMKK